MGCSSSSFLSVSVSFLSSQWAEFSMPAWVWPPWKSAPEPAKCPQYYTVPYYLRSWSCIFSHTTAQHLQKAFLNLFTYIGDCTGSNSTLASFSQCIKREYAPRLLNEALEKQCETRTTCENGDSISYGFGASHNQQHLLLVWSQSNAVGRPHAICLSVKLHYVLFWQTAALDDPGIYNIQCMQCQAAFAM